MKVALVLSVLLLGCVPAEREATARSYTGVSFCLGKYKYIATDCDAQLGVDDTCTITIVDEPLRLRKTMPINALAAILKRAQSECP